MTKHNSLNVPTKIIITLSNNKLQEFFLIYAKPLLKIVIGFKNIRVKIIFLVPTPIIATSTVINMKTTMYIDTTITLILLA